MDIEAIVKKSLKDPWIGERDAEEEVLRAALTEMAEGYEQKIAGLESEAILSRALSERIRQLEAERVLDDHDILSALSAAGATDKEWKALTYESGPYDITKPTVFLQRLAKVLAAAPQQKKED